MMVRSMLRAGAWPAFTGISGAAIVAGGCGVAFPAAATVVFPIAFTLLAAAAAFVLDEPASLVVDVTPTGPVRRTAIRSLALLAPLAAGAVLMLAGALRGLALPWAATGLALAGNVVLGFALACVARTRTGEPGAPAAATAVLILMAPSLLPPVARRVSTFPASGGGGLSSNTVWWTVLAACVVGCRRVGQRPAPAPVAARHRHHHGTGPHLMTPTAAWCLRIAGVNGIVNGLGFGGFTIPAIVSVGQGHGILDTFGNPTYGNGPLERIGVPTTVPLLAGFLAACIIQVAGGVLLLWPRPSGIVVSVLGILLCAPFWWGFNLPFAWLNAAVVLTFLVLAWTVQKGSSRGDPSRGSRGSSA